LAGRLKGDEKISVVVLNDVINVHSSGTMTRIAQIERTTWLLTATARSPAERFLRGGASTRALMRV